jgi:MoaA/NifB/PqqE/SkfB family radical SAM enzyme
MNPEMAKISMEASKYLPQYNITINTNGGIGAEKDYYELGKSAGVKMQLAVEGISQQSHERYRQNVNFDKLMQNIKAIRRGIEDSDYEHESQSLWFYVIPWAHTVNELSDIVNLAKENKAIIRLAYPRHNPGGHPSYNIKGELVDIITVNKNFDKFDYSTHYGPKYLPYEKLLEFDWGEELPARPMLFKNSRFFNLERNKKFKTSAELELYNYYNQDQKVNCSAESQGNIFISHDLKVYPCCHIATHITSEVLKYRNFNDDPRFNVLIEAFYRSGGITTYDLRKRPLEQITNDQTWRSLTFTHLEGKKIIKHCEEICGLCI